MRSGLSTSIVLVVHVQICHGWEAGEWTGGRQRSDVDLERRAVIDYVPRVTGFTLKIKETS